MNRPIILPQLAETREPALVELDSRESKSERGSISVRLHLPRTALVAVTPDGEEALPNIEDFESDDGDHGLPLVQFYLSQN